MKETENDWDQQPGDVPLNPAHVAQAMKATGQDKAAEKAKPITAPALAEKRDAPEAPQNDLDLPNDVRELLELMHEGEAELAKIPSNKRVAANRQFITIAAGLNQIKAKFHALQQGLPVIDVSADHMAKSQNRRDEIANREIWEMRARADHHIADLLSAHDKLAAQVDQLTKDLESATAPKQ